MAEFASSLNWISLKKQLVCFFSFFTLTMFSQNSVSGKVIDTTNQPVTAAAVQIKNLESTDVLVFGYTDNVGKFNLELKNKGRYLIYIRSLGMEPFIKKIDINSNSINLGEITLQESTTELKNVIVKKESAGMTEIGDTLRYRIEKFLNGTEETLKDVIKKLPGLDIDAQGKIKAHGKEVNTLLIDGKEFFINQQKIATENITAEMVKNIELIKNYTAFKNINKNNKSDITALNINIKEKFKNKINGNIAVGVGDNKYKLHSTLFKFTNKMLFSLISDSNNTGETAITIEDYVKFTNQKEDGIVGETTFTRNDDLPRFLTIGNNVKERSSSFNGLNLKYSPTKKTEVNFYTLFNSINQLEQQSNTQLYILESGNFTNQDSQNIAEKTVFTISSLDVAHKFDKSSIFSYKNYFSSTNKRYDSDINNNSNLFNVANKQNDFSFNQHFNYTTLFNKQKALNVTLNQELIQKSTNLNIDSNSPFLNLDFTDSNYTVFQRSNYNKNRFNVNANYSFEIKKTINSFFVDSTIKNEIFKTDEPQFASFINNITTNTNIQSIGLQTQFKISNKSTIASTLSYAKAQFKTDQINESKLLFTPRLSFKTEFNSSHYLKLTYSKNNDLAQAENLITNRLIADYRTIRSNRDTSINTITPSDQASLDYFYFNSKNKTTLISNTSYYKATNIISNNSIATIAANTIQYAVAPYENRFNSMFFAEKTFSSLPITVKASGSYTTSNKILFYDSSRYNFNTVSTSTYLSFLSRFKETSLQLEAGVQTSQDNYTQLGTSNSIKITNPFVETSFKINDKLSFVSRFAYFKTNISNNKNEIYQVNPSIRYSNPKSKIEISLIAHDILNIKNYKQTSLTRFDNYTEVKSAQSLAGYLLFQIKLKL